jgi:S-formylglutathione hydrolase FrmB
LSTSRPWRDLYEAGQIREVILGYPNGFRSGYMDHYDGKVMVESMIIGELIPRIDKRYRTVAGRAGRAVHGFSMGASGSLKFAIKYPELFCAAVAYGGGAINLEHSTSPFILNILERNLNSDPDLIRQNNTYRLLEKNHAQVRRNGIRFLLICGEDGSWRDSAVSFQAALQRRHIPCQLTLVPKTGHNLGSLSRAEGAAAAIFQDQVFKTTRAE